MCEPMAPELDALKEEKQVFSVAMKSSWCPNEEVNRQSGCHETFMRPKMALELPE